MNSAFYKNYSKEFTGTSPLLDSASPITKPMVEPIVKQKCGRDRLTKSAKQAKKGDQTIARYRAKFLEIHIQKIEAFKT